MEERYIKNFPALSEADMELLESKKVFIAGSGGLGGYILEFMLRLGVGKIKICDGDVFSETNLNRQLLCTEKNIGLSKVSQARLRAEAVNSNMEFESSEDFINEENAEELIKGYDAVMDGLDNPESRKLLFSACEKLGIPYIYGAISGFTAQCAVLLPGSRLLDTMYRDDEGTDSPALSFTPAFCAAMECGLCVKLLCGKELQSGRLYCADLYNMDFENFLFD